MLSQHVPFEVAVIRWFQSREIWTYICGLVLTLAPIVTNSLSSLGLTPIELLVWTLCVQVAVSSAGLYFKNQSSAVIGSKNDVAASNAAPAPTSAPTP